jgi:hypothetical protein
MIEFENDSFTTMLAGIVAVIIMNLCWLLEIFKEKTKREN